jgi:hypothetical protein
VKTVDSGGEVIVKGDVKQFFAREESTYKSTVAIHLTVIDQNGVVNTVSSILRAGTSAPLLSHVPSPAEFTAFALKGPRSHLSRMPGDL